MEGSQHLPNQRWLVADPRHLELQRVQHAGQHDIGFWGVSPHSCPQRAQLAKCCLQSLTQTAGPASLPHAEYLLLLQALVFATITAANPGCEVFQGLQHLVHPPDILPKRLVLGRREKRAKPALACFEFIR